MIPTIQKIAELRMERQAVLLFLIAVAYSSALPTASSCSPIIPSDTANCENPMNRTAARHFVLQEIIPSFDNMLTNLWRVRDDLENITTSRGPYQLDNRTICERSGDDNEDRLNADCISSSVYRFKCEVPLVAEIVKNETIRNLVDEESSFAKEYQDILKALNVLPQLKKLVSSHGSLNSCNVPENACAEITYTGRLESLKSISEDLYRLVADVTTAMQGYYSI